MGAAQDEQRPRSRAKLSRGMFSHQPKGCPHFGHREPGHTTDSPRGRRWIRTLLKDPRIAPKANARNVTWPVRPQRW
jgi:hypothetical protein